VITGSRVRCSPLTVVTVVTVLPGVVHRPAAAQQHRDADDGVREDSRSRR
jgi:hypothetical protein